MKLFVKLYNKVIKDVSSGSVFGILIFALISFVVMVGSLNLITSIAKNNKTVCSYVGKIWLDERFRPDIENPVFGCFTYRELAEFGKL